jgi:hypothetical protein
MDSINIWVVAVLTGLCLAVSGCGDDDDDIVDGGAAGDADTDADTDIDTDADIDSDCDECEDGESRCDGDMVQRCEDSCWQDWDDCAAQNTPCAVIQGEAQCIGSDSDADTDNECEGEITFPDVNLDAFIRELLGVSSDYVIRSEDVYQITSVEANEQEISDLKGMECMTGLIYLDMSDNQISSISPLVDNAGINNEDEVNIKNNDYDCEDPNTLDDIQTLVDRGVGLIHDC